MLLGLSIDRCSLRRAIKAQGIAMLSSGGKNSLGILIGRGIDRRR